MNKSFLKISFVGIGHIINALLGFVFLTALARTMSLDDFGKYALITSILVAVAKLTDFGTNSLYVAESITHEDKKITNIFYSLKILLLLITIPISLFILYIFNIREIEIILLFLAGLIAYTVNLTLYSLFQKLENFPFVVLINGIIAIIKAIFAVVIFFNLLIPTVTSAFAIFSLSVFPSLILAVFLPKELKNVTFSLQNIKEFFNKSYPAGMSLVVSESWSAISNTMAKWTHGFSNVGIFSLADKVSNIFALLSLSIFTVLLPKNARRKKENLEYDFKETFLISGIIILLAISGIIFSELFLTKLFGNKFIESVGLLDLMIVASALIAINSFMENYFFVEGKTKYLLNISIIKLGTYLVAASFMLNKYNLQGIAVAQIISGIITSIFIFSVARRNIKSK